MKDGLGMRWAFMGPFETIELNAPEGADDYFQRYCGLFRDMAAEPPGQTVFDPFVTKSIVQNWQTRWVRTIFCGVPRGGTNVWPACRHGKNNVTRRGIVSG